MTATAKIPAPRTSAAQAQTRHPGSLAEQHHVMDEATHPEVTAAFYALAARIPAAPRP